MLERQSLQDIHPQFEDAVAKQQDPRYLITLDVGIGDAVAIGLSAVDQIIRNDPAAYGNIDVLCNGLQGEIFAYDPRINNILVTDITFFPSLEPTTWLKTIFLDHERASMVHLLRERHYKAVFPSIVAPGLYLGLHSRIMLPNILKLMKDLLIQHYPVDGAGPMGRGDQIDRHPQPVRGTGNRDGAVSLRTFARQMVNRSFGKKIPDAALEEEEVLLYLGPEHVRKAMQTAGKIKQEANVGNADSRLLVVAPDSATDVTRPPTELLAAALSEALEEYHNLIVCILPSYTDTAAAENLRSSLSRHFDERVFLLPVKPRATLLETAAFLDQADIFVSGDTGVMHLAAASKRLKPGSNAQFRPRNTIKIITLFGGTNPDYYGYRHRATIVGSGRKEQKAFRPGFSKEAYNTRGRNLFDHIDPREVTQAILNQVSLL
jgi:ADP-heptose:LPS heptosyltransferase